MKSTSYDRIFRALAVWVDALAVASYRGREVTGMRQDDAGVDVMLSDCESLRAGSAAHQVRYS
jgi:hypothetical protein